MSEHRQRDSGSNQLAGAGAERTGRRPAPRRPLRHRFHGLGTGVRNRVQGSAGLSVRARQHQCVDRRVLLLVVHPDLEAILNEGANHPQQLVGESIRSRLRRPLGRRDHVEAIGVDPRWAADDLRAGRIRIADTPSEEALAAWCWSIRLVHSRFTRNPPPAALDWLGLIETTSNAVCGAWTSCPTSVALHARSARRATPGLISGRLRPPGAPAEVPPRRACRPCPSTRPPCSG